MSSSEGTSTDSYYMVLQAMSKARTRYFMHRMPPELEKTAETVAVLQPVAAAILCHGGLDLKMIFIFKCSALEFTPSSALYLSQKAEERVFSKIKRLPIVS